MLRKIVGYTGVLYLCVAVALFFLIDHKKMKLYRLDVLVDYATYPMLLNLGKEKLNSQKLRASKIYYRMVSSISPDAYRAYEMQGYCYFWLGEYARSQGMFKKALELSPRSFWIEFDMAVAEYKQGQYEKASILLKHILSQPSEEQWQGSILALLKDVHPSIKKDMFDNIAVFVNDVRNRSYELLRHFENNHELKLSEPLAVPLMHPWSNFIPPGKEIFYD